VPWTTATEGMAQLLLSAFVLLAAMLLHTLHDVPVQVLMWSIYVSHKAIR